MEEIAIAEPPEESQPTKWNAICLASTIACFTALENTVLGVSEYAYVEQMDPKATAEFYGTASSIARGGHAVFAVLFSLYAYKTKLIKQPLLFGRLLSILACCVYLSVEYFPDDRRYLMGICYLFFDIATSAPTVLKAYIIAVSSPADLPRAFAALTLANWISVVIGPVFQLLFTGIPYPGFELLPGLRFHLYSAPIWLALFMNFVSIALIYRCLDDPPSQNGDHNFSLLLLAEKVMMIPQLKLEWSSIAMVWVLRLVVNLSVVTLMILTAPLLMVVFGYSGDECVRANSISSAFVGLFALGVTIIFMWTRVGYWVSSLLLLTIALLSSVAMYLVSYPYTVFSTPLVPYNETSHVGCDSSKYPWCDTALAGNAVLFLGMAAIQTGIGLPMAQIALDTVYSRVLGNINQNVMQGAFVAFEDLIYVLGPLYVSQIFTHYGQDTLWMLNLVIVFFGFFLIIKFYYKYK